MSSRTRLHGDKFCDVMVAAFTRNLSMAKLKGNCVLNIDTFPCTPWRCAFLQRQSSCTGCCRRGTPVVWTWYDRFIKGNIYSLGQYRGRSFLFCLSLFCPDHVKSHIPDVFGVHVSMVPGPWECEPSSNFSGKARPCRVITIKDFVFRIEQRRLCNK